MLWLWLACATPDDGPPDRDRDWDGFVTDDCDPDDPDVYPGAPDVPGDGVDADCDGVDPDPVFAGTWPLTHLDAFDLTANAFGPDSEGELVADPDGTTTLWVDAVASAELFGTAHPAGLDYAGTASAAADGTVYVFLRGSLTTDRVEESELELECVVDGDLACGGAMKALNTTLDATLVFTR